MQGHRITISLIRPDQSMHVKIDPDLTEYGGNLISFAHGERPSKLCLALIQHGLGLIFLDAIPQFIYFSSNVVDSLRHSPDVHKTDNRNERGERNGNNGHEYGNDLQMFMKINSFWWDSPF